MLSVTLLFDLTLTRYLKTGLLQKKLESFILKYLFYIVVSTTLFLAFSPGHFTPSLMVNHDKVAHFCAFFVLSFGMKFSFPTYSIKRIFFIMAFLAMGIEVVQHFFTTRELSIIDFAASLAGIFVFLTMLKIIAKRYAGFGVTYKVSS